MGQFHPWRAFAARSLRSGSIPLWNPYEFCGAPFVANSQSAIFYPGNLLYYVLRPEAAAGWTVLLHLVLAACFTWLFARGIGAGDAGGAVAGIAFAFSTWQVSWLQLPTFLCTSCWLPLALLLTTSLYRRPAVRTSAGLAGVLGLMLLAGHLQIAFYVLLACALLAVCLLAAPPKLCAAHFPGEEVDVEAPVSVPWKGLAEGGPTSNPGVADRRLKASLLFLGSLVLALMVAAPQLLPTLELSRRSHRAGPPSAAGYGAYVAYAVPPDALVTLFQPDYFGNPSRPDAPYVGRSRGGLPFNYAEGALYAGLPTLFLAAFGLARRRRNPWALYLTGLAALALLMALGTAVDAALYFYVPGFGQSGSPGRALVLWAFGLSSLAGLGVHSLLRENTGTARPAIISAGGLAVLWAAAYALVGSLGGQPGIGANTGIQAALFVCSAAALLGAASFRFCRIGCAAALGALLIADLFAHGMRYNQTARPSEVYAHTAITRLVARLAGHDRIAPINSDWSFGGPTAVLPPNSALALRLRDVQGYDSLFPGRYKAFMNRLAGPARDASPIQVGNMVFAKDPYSPLLLAAGVRVVLSLAALDLRGARESYEDGVYVYALPDAPGRVSATKDDGSPAKLTWLQDDLTRVRITAGSSIPCTVRLADELYPGWHASVDHREVPIELDNGIFRRIRAPAGRHEIAFEYRPAGFRLGLYLMLLGVAVLVAAGLAATGRR